MAKKTINKELTGAQDLYNFLFEACNIIRGPVSQDNFKDYITPLLYYKRISDVYDEETEEALISSGGDKEYASLPEQHRFVIPDGCHWQEVRERTENLGAAIVGAMRQIEIANPDTLYGVLSMFSSQKWNNKAILKYRKILATKTFSIGTRIKGIKNRKLKNIGIPTIKATPWLKSEGKILFKLTSRSLPLRDFQRIATRRAKTPPRPENVP